MEETFAHRRQQVQARTTASSTAAENRHLTRVAVKPTNVVFYPSQGHYLVFHSVVARQYLVFET